MFVLFYNKIGDVVCDSYYKYEEDVEILKDYGVKVYCFFIVWSCVFFNGIIDYVNNVGVEYYKRFIVELS